ncbi:MAG: hypothetical protein ACRDTJ_17610, partial [Pseudonocardiaceae bacterium]
GGARRGDLRGDIVELLAALALAMAQPTGWGICQLTLELILDRSRHPDLPGTVIDKLRRPRLAAIMEHSPGLPAMSNKAACHLRARRPDRTSPRRSAPTRTRQCPTRHDITVIVDLVLMPALTNTNT